MNNSVLKAFDALDLLGPERPELSADALTRELGMTYATAHRFLKTLAASGILVARRRGVFVPGPRLAQLGRMAEQLSPLPPALQDILDDVRRELGESVMACRYSPQGPVCVAVSAADRPITVNIRIGTTLPMLATAQGRLWLADMSDVERENWARRQSVPQTAFAAIQDTLEQVRTDGHALNRGYNEPDIGAVSVPVRSDGQIILTLSAFGMLRHFDAALNARAERLLTSAARRLQS